MVDGWYFLFACLSGWRMLRFPERHPWAKAHAPVMGVYEVRPAAEAPAAR